MGLIGYINDEVRRRSKEIAIRKINGAEARSILFYYLKISSGLQFSRFAIGTYGAYYMSLLWISQFEDTICVYAGWYVVTAICLLVFIFVFIIGRSWHIANENPVNSIKSE